MNHCMVWPCLCIKISLNNHVRIKIETVCTLQQSGQTNRNSSSPLFPSIGPTSLRGSNHYKLHVFKSLSVPTLSDIIPNYCKNWMVENRLIFSWEKKHLKLIYMATYDNFVMMIPLLSFIENKGNLVIRRIWSYRKIFQSLLCPCTKIDKILASAEISEAVKFQSNDFDHY